MNLNEEIAARFVAVRKNEGLKQSELAELLGIGRGTISMIETGGIKLTDRNLKSFCKAFSINENWLRTGQGNMHSTPSRSPELETEEEIELIRLFRQLSAETKRMVLAIVQKFLHNNEEESLPAVVNAENSSAISTDGDEKARMAV